MSLDDIDKTLHESAVDAHTAAALAQFSENYFRALPSEDPTAILQTYIRLVARELACPTPFNHFQAMERVPFDFYEFGRSIVKPLIDCSRSYIAGEDNLKEIIKAIEHEENVILLANHQTEIDPQIISLLVSPLSDLLATSMIFVAGHRVTSDPMAIPFSRGVNLLSIFSKKYIDIPPEKKAEKLLHNAKTLAKVEELLNEGGKCIYVAPSGGRDRYDDAGNVTVSAFDPQSVEMFHLFSQKSARPTHLHLLALSTIQLLPPPPVVNVELGEARHVSFAPARLAFGPALDLSTMGSDPDKKIRRMERAEILTASLKELYLQIAPEGH